MSAMKAAIKENLSVYVDEYLSWIVLTFIVCAMPILFTPLFADLSVAFSSILAYSFTLIGTNLYCFDHLASVKIDGVSLAKSRKAAAYGLMLAAVIMFIAYNLHIGLNTWVNGKIVPAMLMSAGLAFISVMLLAVPQINQQVEDTKRRKKEDRVIRDVERMRDASLAIRKEVEKEDL